METIIFNNCNDFSDSISILNKSIGNSKQNWEEIDANIKTARKKLSNLAMLVKMKIRWKIQRIIEPLAISFYIML